MNKMKYIYGLILILLLYFCLPVFSKPEIIVEKNGNVTNYRLANDPIKLAQDYQALSKEEKEKFIKEKVLATGNALPIHLIAMADDIYLSKNGDATAAVFFYLLGSLRGMQDSASCEDKSAFAQVQIYPLLAQNTVQYMVNMDSKNLVNIANKVVEWDEKNTQRVSPQWACYHGMQAFYDDDVKIKSENERIKIQKEIRESFIKSINKMEEAKQQYK